MSLLADYKNEEHQLIRSMKATGGYSLIAGLCMLGMPLFMFQVYDSVLISRSLPTLAGLFAFALIILIAYGFFDHVRQILMAKAALQFESKLSGLILAGELSRQSDTTAQTVRDLGTIRQVLASPAFYALFDLALTPLFLFLIFLIHPVLGVVVTLGAGILFAIGLWADRSTAGLNQAHNEAMIASHKSLEMHMGAQEYIRGQGMYRESVKSWGAHHGVQLEAFTYSFGLTSKFAATSKAMRQIVQILMIGSGALLVLADLATAGVIFGTAIIGGRALQPVEQVVGGWRALKGAYDTRKRLIARVAELSLPENRTKLPKPKGILSVERVAYTPRPGVPPIIRGISAVFEAGDTVAIIGPSGAGKSTLAKLLVGYLAPNAGRIALDGQDLHAWDPVARGIHVGYMPQQVAFFDATIRENIARLRTGDPEEWALNAAKAAGVHDLIMRMPQGYDTMIQRGGFMPSGGQTQLIGLARAFYGDPSVLILDEPNASLDAGGEQILHQALGRAKQRGITTLVVSQRPSILQFVDKVMIVQDGLVKDYGPKEKVMGAGSVKAVASNPNAQQQAAQKANAAQSNAASQQTKDAKPVSKKPGSGTKEA